MAYCVYCMNEGEDAVCHVCGKSQKEYVSAAHHLKPGSLLNGKYLVGAVIGEGGFGITYVGRDVNLDLKIAVKEYYPSGMVNRNNLSTGDITANIGNAEAIFEKGKKDFLGEARTLAKFANEPNVVTVRDFFEENNTAYIIMDYLEGEDLKTYLEKSGPLPFSAAFSMLSPVMSVLKKIHAQGLIHRDISPANIMLLHDGTVKLLDFGAARNVSTTDEKSLSVLLKPGFAPEEQYRSKGNQGAWTDVYALSATLYKMVTGVTPDDVMNRLFSDEVQPPSELNPQISEAQSAVILKGMSVYQKDRYQGVDALQQACAACLYPSCRTADVGEAFVAAEKTVTAASVRMEPFPNTVYQMPSMPAERAVMQPESKPEPPAVESRRSEAAEKQKKEPKRWGLVGSIVFGLIALLNFSVLLGDIGDPTLQTSDLIGGGIGLCIFAAAAIGFGYFYYPRVDNAGKKPNKAALVGSMALSVAGLLLAFAGFNAFGSDLAERGTGESFIGLAAVCAGAAVYLGYFYYPRLEKKKRRKCWKVYGGAMAAVVAIGVIYTVFVTMSTVSIGDQNIKKSVETLEINADLLSDADMQKLTQLENLKSLSLQACLLDDADVAVIGAMTQLEKLSLMGNVDVKDISPLGNLTELTFLNLELTGVEDISCLSKLTKLKQLSVSETKVRDVSPIQDLAVLETCYMNNLENLDQSTIQLPETVTAFYCCNNGLTDIAFLEDLISLSTVELSGNSLTDITPLASKPLFLVKIHDNLISDIAPVSNAESELDASGNRIGDISCLKGIRTTTLALSDNEIREVSALEGNNRIRSLDLSSNQITDISPLKDCFSIYDLNLSGNQISDISSLATVDDLDVLDLSHNRISDLSPLAQNPGYFDTEHALYLQNNQITDLSPLAGFVNCSMIQLQNNLVEDVSPLKGCAALEYLNIRNNQVSDLSVLAGMPGLRVLLASENPVAALGGLSLVSGGNVIEHSVLSVSYTEQIDWQQVKSLSIDEIRVYDIPDRMQEAMSGLGYRTNYDSSVQEEEHE